MSVHLALGEPHGTVRPPACPDSDRVSETCPGFLSNGEPDSARTVRSFRNGSRQHLMFLGISGFVVCNHCDREILLVDPWPSCHSRWTELVPTVDGRPLTNGDTGAKERIANLASFLRNAVQQEYVLSGILLSHMHFDHSDDIPLLLELLTADSNNYTDHLGRQFLLGGPQVPAEALPKICCDYDTLLYLLTCGLYVPYQSIHLDVPGRETNTDEAQRQYWYGNDALREVLDRQDRARYADRSTPAWRKVKARYISLPGTWVRPEGGPAQLPRPELMADESWLEINVGGHRLHYDDSYNVRRHEEQRCRAGWRCAEFSLGTFCITPYVWDHMNTGAGKWTNRALDEQCAGDLQRTTAFMIQHSRIEHAKRTFVIGSSGEMNRSWTEALARPLPIIETDLLIQAIVRPQVSVMAFRRQISAMQDFLLRCIRVEDAIIFTHFEEFVREVASSSMYAEGFDAAVAYNLDTLREKIEEAREQGHLARADRYTRLIDENRLYALARRNFEIDMLDGPTQFRDEENSHCGALSG